MKTTDSLRRRRLFFLMPKEPAWWVWLITAVMLALGLAGQPVGFLLAIGISVVQAGVFWLKTRWLMAIPVQIRLGYSALLLLCLVPMLHWLFWLPAVGTVGLLVFGYCLMA